MSELLYPFAKEEIQRINVAFGCPDSDEDYCPECLDVLRNTSQLDEKLLGDLQYELELIVSESIGYQFDDMLYMDRLQDAECAIECLRYIRFAYERGKLNTL